MDPLSMIFDWIDSGQLPGIVVRIPDSDAVIVNTALMFTSAHTRDGLALLEYFGEPLLKSFWFIEPLERCRHIAFGLGWDINKEVARWSNSPTPMVNAASSVGRKLDV
jgi:hypothetical protein